ncbi:tetratricopeptide repeat protein [Gemmatimonas sp.]|uniref:tetratricopeptide repeat protein n=1 Tax=Gemmatimonas sp. TaxID=1962908 RepID=UPI0037BE66DB
MSDDPIESVTTWFQVNSKPILMAVGAVAATAAAVMLYRSSTASTREKASTALYEAQTPYVQGKLPEAEKALGNVATRYASTAAGQQAAVLLAQVLFDQNKIDDGLKALEKALGSSSAEFKPTIEALIASGYEQKKDFVKAAEHYAKAASASQFKSDKYSHQASQARSLATAGKTADALKIWEDLAKLDGEPIQQEANVRVGELVAKK